MALDSFYLDAIESMICADHVRLRSQESERRLRPNFVDQVATAQAADDDGLQSVTKP